MTDRYTKAIDQLGSDKLDVRIGGIHALQRIARDSARDHLTIMEVLAAFIREHSPEPWPPPAGDEHGTAPPGRETRPDVRAAVTVLKDRNPRYDQRSLSLVSARLPGADLIGADFAYVRLSGADLSGADLSYARLSLADLSGADLSYATIFGAIFTNADLSGALWPEVADVPEGWQRDDAGRLTQAETSPGGEATE